MPFIEGRGMKGWQIVIENAPRPSDAGALSSEIKKLL